MDALSPQILPADPAPDVSFLAALAADATGAAVSPVDGAASAAASDDTAPADESRAPTAPLIGAAEGTVPLVAGSAADISADAAATADDAGAPQLMQKREQCHRSPRPPSIPLFHLQKRAPRSSIFYLRRRPLSLLLVVHANIPLSLPLRNAIRQPTIYRRSIAASVPLVPAKATEGAGGWLLLRKCRTMPRVTIGAASVLLLRTLVGTVAVVATAVLRRRPRNIIAGTAAATAV